MATCKELTEAEKGEIVMMYRQAANRRKQISILADLFLKTTQEIKQVLIDAGAIPDPKSIPKSTSKRVAGKRWKLWTEEEEEILCNMRRNGEGYKEIAGVLGRSFQSVSYKAQSLGL